MPVTSTPRTTVRYPAQRAKDLRIAVTIEDPALPVPLVVYFLEVVDRDADAWAVIPVGVELGLRFDREPGDDGSEPFPIDRLPRPLEVSALEHVTARFGDYIGYARGCLAIHGAPRGGTLPEAGSPKRRRREMTDDFLAGIGREYAMWSEGEGRAVTQIASAHGVDVSTASRWVQGARRRGFLSS